MSWTTRRLGIENRAIMRRPSARVRIGCETLEGRALMAVGPSLVATAATPTPIVFVSPGLSTNVQSSNPALYSALQTFLTDLNSALSTTGGLTAAADTLNADVAAISAASSTSATSSTLASDVSTITSSGTLTTTQAAQLSQDLTVVLASSLSSNFVSSYIAGTTTSQGVAGARQVASPNDLATPGAGTLGGPHGQSITLNYLNVVPGGPGASSVAPGRTDALSQLLGGLKSIFAKSGLSAVQQSDLRGDFVAITAVGHKPDSQVVTSFQTDLAALTAAGALSDDARAKLSTDLAALLQSAGISDRLAARTQADLAPVLNAASVSTSDVSTILTNLTSVLLNLPTAATVPAGPLGASWFTGRAAV